MDPDEEDDIVFDQSTLLTKQTKLRDSHWCYRFFKTVALSLGFFALGLCVAIPGPTLIDLQQRVHTDTLHIAEIFTARSIGYLIGAIIGGCLFDRFNQKMLLGLTLFITTVATATVPWCERLVLLGVAFTFQGLSMGILDTGGNVYCLHIWGKKSGPYLQMMHFLFGVGAFIAPFIAKPFLSADLQYNVTINLNHSSVLFPENNIPFVIPDFDHLRSNLVKYDVVKRSLNLDSQSYESINRRLYINERYVDKETIADGNRFIRDIGNSTTIKAVILKPEKSSADELKAETADGAGIRKHIEETADDVEEKTTPNPPNIGSTVEQINASLVTKNVTNTKTKVITKVKIAAVNTKEPKESTIKISTEIIPTSTEKSTTVKPATTNPATTASNNISTTTINSTTTTVHYWKPKEAVDVFNNAISAIKNMSKIQFVYLVIAVVCLISSMLFFCIYCCDRRMSSLYIQPDNRKSRIAQTSCFRIQLLMLLFVFFFMYVGLEVTFGGFLLTFTVDYLNWTKEDGVLMTGIYWGSIALGRGLAIPISRFLKPTYMLVIDLILVLIAALTLSFALQHYKDIIWVATLVFGLGMSSIFPTGIHWAETYMKVTGKATTVMVVGSALGEMAIPVLTAYFFTTFDKMALMYISLTLSVISIVIFVVLQNLASNRSTRYDMVSRTDDSEMVSMVDYDNDDYVVFSQDSLQSRKRENENGYHKLALSDD